MSTWDELFIEVLPRADREIEIAVRDTAGRERVLDVTPETRTDARTNFEMGDLGVGPALRPEIIQVNAGEPAGRAGMQIGDVIHAINGEPVTGEDLVPRIAGSTGIPLTITVMRDSETQDLIVTPMQRGDTGVIGVQFSPFEMRVVEPGFIEALQMSVDRNYEWSGLIFRTLGGLLTAETSPNQLAGPLGIATMAGQAAEVGWIQLFTLMSMISVNLGLLNLLPIPVLDGGHIFIMAIEGAVRRDFSVQLKERMLLAGFAVMMLLMVTVIYNDLTRIEWIEALMPWR